MAKFDTVRALQRRGIPRELAEKIADATIGRGETKRGLRIDDLKKNDPNNIGISAHESSRDGAKSTAMLSLGVTVGSLAYGYFTGVFSEE